MKSAFEFSLCPVCNKEMRLSSVEPRLLYVEEKYERHIYRCGHCANVSQFIFEYPSRALD